MSIDYLLEPSQVLWILDDLATKNLGHEYSPQATIDQFKHQFPSLTEELIGELYAKEYELRMDVVRSQKVANIIDYIEQLMDSNPGLTSNEIDPILEVFNSSFDLDLTFDNIKIDIINAHDKIIHDGIDLEILTQAYNPSDIFCLNEINVKHDEYHITFTLTGNLNSSEILPPLIISNLNTHSYNYHPTGSNNLIHLNLYLQRLNCYLSKKNQSILLILANNVYINFHDYEFIEPYYINKVTNNAVDVKLWLKNKILKVLTKNIGKFPSKHDIVIQLILQEYEKCVLELKTSPMMSKLNHLQIINSKLDDLKRGKDEIPRSNWTNARSAQDVYIANILFERFMNQKPHNTNIDEIINFVNNKFYPYILHNAKCLEKPTLDILTVLLEKHEKSFPTIEKKTSFINTNHQTIISNLIYIEHCAITGKLDKENGKSMVNGNKKRSNNDDQGSRKKLKTAKLDTELQTPFSKELDSKSEDIESHSFSKKIVRNAKLSHDSTTSTNLIPEDISTSTKIDKPTDSNTISISSNGSSFERPIFSYSELIGMAMVEKSNEPMTKHQVIEWIKSNYPFFKEADKWQLNVRKTLNKNFKRNETKSGVLWLTKEEEIGKYQRLYNQIHQETTSGDTKKSSIKSFMVTPSTATTEIAKDQINKKSNDTDNVTPKSKVATKLKKSSKDSKPTTVSKPLKPLKPINPLDRIPKLNKLKLPSTTIETKTSLVSPNQTLKLFDDEIDSDHFDHSDEESD